MTMRTAEITKRDDCYQIDFVVDNDGLKTYLGTVFVNSYKYNGEMLSGYDSGDVFAVSFVVDKISKVE